MYAVLICMCMWPLESGESANIISSKFFILFLSLSCHIVLYKQNRPIITQLISCLMQNRLVYFELGRRSTCSVSLSGSRFRIKYIIPKAFLQKDFEFLFSFRIFYTFKKNLPSELSDICNSSKRLVIHIRFKSSLIAYI